MNEASFLLIKLTNMEYGVTFEYLTRHPYPMTEMQETILPK